MRQIGTIENGQNASLLAEYLVAEGISAHAEQENEKWAIWVRDENQVDRATSTFREFVADPTHTRYQDGAKKAEAVRQEQRKRRDEARKNMINMRGKWNRGAAQRSPVTFLMIGACVLLSIFSGTMGGGRSELAGQLMFAGNLTDPFASILQGQVWRIVTPIFLHFGIVHLVFNIWILLQFGGLIEARRGTLRFAILVLTIAVISNLGQAIGGAYFPSDIVGRSVLFGGMSGVNYGLFGYIWMKTLYDPGAGMHVNQGTVFMLLAWLFLCMTPFLGIPIANAAHVVGLAVGVAIGYAPTLFPDRNR